MTKGHKKNRPLCAPGVPLCAPRSLIYKDEGELALGADVVADVGGGFDGDEGAAAPVQGGADCDGVTGTDGVLEADFVHAGVEGHVVFEFLFKEQDAALRHDFTQDYSRDDGIAGKMPVGVVGVIGDGVLGFHTIIGALRMVHKEHGVSVGHDLHQFLSVHLYQLLKRRSTTAAL